MTLERSPFTAAKYDRTSFRRKRFPDSVPISAICVDEKGGGEEDGDCCWDADLDAKESDCWSD